MGRVLAHSSINPSNEKDCFMDKAAREFEFSDKHFARISSFVTAQTGILLPAAKKDMVYSRLSKHVRRNYGGSFDAFCLAVDNGDPDTIELLINAITTNLTAFFREKHHFDYLKQHVLPELLIKNQATKKIRIWSAGCSTGEEPYSLAICLHQFFKGYPGWDVKVLATDLDANVLEQAASGIYTVERVSQFSEEEKRAWFSRGKAENNGLVKVKSFLKEFISLRRINLLHPFPMKGTFDVIFCRNVIIYFDKTTQVGLFHRFAEKMLPGGYLFIGHSETLFNISNQFVSDGNTIYRRIT